jgi:hypothetical protein
MRSLEGVAPAVPAYPSSGGDYVMEAKGDTVGTNIFIENYRSDSARRRGRCSHTRATMRTTSSTTATSGVERDEQHPRGPRGGALFGLTGGRTRSAARDRLASRPGPSVLPSLGSRRRRTASSSSTGRSVEGPGAWRWDQATLPRWLFVVRVVTRRAGDLGSWRFGRAPPVHLLASAALGRMGPADGIRADQVLRPLWRPQREGGPSLAVSHRSPGREARGSPPELERSPLEPPD